jgi:hypothetical protein
MDSLKKHGDPLDEEIRRDPVRGAEEVGQNQPGSKGDGSVTRAGAGTADDGETGEAGEIVRSARQRPNPNQPSDDATMEPGGDQGHKRTNM